MAIERYQRHIYQPTGKEGIYDYVLERYLTEDEVSRLENEFEDHLKSIDKLIK